MLKEPLNTISGSSAIYCDVIPSLLAERIDQLSVYGPLFEALTNNHFIKSGYNLNSGSVFSKPECHLEVEVRLGFIQNIRSEHRFTLPVTTDTLLASRAPVKFVPGVTEDQYNAARNFLIETSDEDDLKNEWSTCLNSCTINRFFEIQGYEELVRISVLSDSNSPVNRQQKEPIDAIRKVNLLTWNISSGSNEEPSEDSEEFSTGLEGLDYRIAINLEYKVPLTNLPTTSNAKYCRRRLRDSFVHTESKMRFDLSKVEDVTENKDPTISKFEIEIELLGEEIVKTLMDKTLSSDQRLMNLKYYCSTLIRSSRYIMDLLSSKNERLKYSSFINSISEKVGVYDLRIVSQDAESVERYKRYLSPQLPLIGDYLYRTVSVNLEKNPDMYNNRKSLYTQETQDIPGPFVVKIDTNGHRYVTIDK
uniref:mRNA 5'-phosphatase n=1 Tax=Theileria annulata TaxID=5874 RepID=A0A3B0MHW7_THEAN